MANTTVAGYPTTVGNKTHSMFDHTGPSSYANVGTSSGAGDAINASDLGFGGFDSIMPVFPSGFLEGYTASGNFIVKVGTGTSGTALVATYPKGNAFTKATLQWFTTAAAFGAISTEVANTTDLSAEVLRFDAVVV